MIKDTIERVIERMKKYRSLYEQNEMAVRDQIVNPILRSLGWDPENPEEVQPNVSTEEGVPDYSLLKNGNKALFIEAKKLSVDVEQKEVIRQLAKYCFGEGMKYGVLTNGAIWILFRAFQEGTTMAERIVWKVDIESDDISASIRRLNTTSKDNVENIETLIKKLQILDEIWQSLLEEPKEMIKGLIPVFEGLIKEGYPDYVFEISDIEDFIKERVRELISSPYETVTDLTSEPKIWKGVERPRKMIIGTDTYEIRNSFEILVNTANWLIEKGKLKKSDCPISAGHKRNLVNLDPKHKYGDSFRSAKRLSNGLWIETSYGTAGCINYARRLLERYDYKGNMLEVQ
ncbi:MAG: type I restriction enzyme HsdR N-terminal domain-containing protein [Methanosarcinales archaeon]